MLYHNILVPIALYDETQDRRAVEIARALASENARLTLLHVMEEPPTYAAGYLPRDQFEKNERESAEKLDALAQAEGLQGPRRAVWGHPARSILDEAAENRADCIVMHSHRPSVQDYFIGSTAAHVVRHAACSVHVIR
jgi:nucleotide-binding universal stress UspA family protein